MLVLGPIKIHLLERGVEGALFHDESEGKDLETAIF